MLVAPGLPERAEREFVTEVQVLVYLYTHCCSTTAYVP
jgi:hypothetical protein